MSSSNDMASMLGDESLMTLGGDPEESGDEYGVGDREWLDIARAAFSQSTDWFESSVSGEWQKNTAHFQSRHYGDRKSSSTSRIFRPKTRTMVRRHEASVAQALFSGGELVSVTTNDDDDPVNLAAAAVHQELLAYRLDNSIPWFLTAVGAYQDAMVSGVCVSYQYWDFQERIDIQPVTDQTGAPLIQDDGEAVTQEVRRIVFDQPRIDLLPPESVRFDPAADWRDPINSSPYVIRIVPMYLADIRQRMATSQNSSQPWRYLSDAEILSAQERFMESMRRAREEDRADSAEAGHGEFKTIWLHEVFLRKDGQDYVYWTVGTEAILSDPVPVSQVYLHGKRPLVMGMATIDAHRVYPTSLTGMTTSLQEQANEIINQRIDNVRLVLNKRYFIRRGQNIDIEALMRNVPGGGVMVDDPHQDVNIVSTPDVTQSSYVEQDRLDLAFDDISGTFAQSSVQANRNLNETVGGMNLLNGNASAMAEYTIRTWVETWVEPVLRQLILLEQFYETDDRVMAIAAKKADLFRKFGVRQITQGLLQQEVNLFVNVGMGAVNGEQRVQRLLFGLNAVAQLPGIAEKLDTDAITAEIFGAMGYRSGERFFKKDEQMGEPQPPPEAAALQAQMQLKQAELQLKQAELQLKQQDFQARSQDRQAEIQSKAQIEERRIQLEAARAQAQARAENERTMMQAQMQMAKLQQERDLRMADLASREQTTMAQIQARSGYDSHSRDRQMELQMAQLQQRMQADERRAAVDMAKIKTQRDVAAIKSQIDMNEMKMKREIGSGI